MTAHLAFPLRLAGRSLATVEHDSPQDIEQSVRLLLNTRPGERRSVPGYGMPDPLFGREVDLQEVVATVAEWEDRAVLDDIDLSTLHHTNPHGFAYGEGLYGDGNYGGARDAI